MREGVHLLSLSDQDLRTEQRRLESELARYQSDYAEPFAAQDRARMVANGARVAETQASVTLIELQLSRIDIYAPFDGMIIKGSPVLKGSRIDSYGDHRIAMAFAIAGLFAEGETIIEGVECVDTSYPGFETELKRFMSSKISEGERTPTITSVTDKSLPTGAPKMHHNED